MVRRRGVLGCAGALGCLVGCPVGSGRAGKYMFVLLVRAATNIICNTAGAARSVRFLPTLLVSLA